MAQVKMHVERFMGMVIGMKTIATNFGEAVAFLGDLRGIHPITGEVSKAGTLYLPDIATEPLAAAIAASEGRPGNLVGFIRLPFGDQTAEIHRVCR